MVWDICQDFQVWEQDLDLDLGLYLVFDLDLDLDHLVVQNLVWLFGSLGIVLVYDDPLGVGRYIARWYILLRIDMEVDYDDAVVVQVELLGNPFSEFTCDKLIAGKLNQ